jgi:hypothetical protein
VQALEAYQEAARCNPDSKEVASKVKALGRLVRSPASQNGSTQRPAGSNGAINTSHAYKIAKVTMMRTLCVDLHTRALFLVTEILNKVAIVNAVLNLQSPL